ncbi:hypothetical protein Asp14428_73440 [Actinoplanes sp. NBRC 14428]|nr:hypothetical protein Asp14428_73440 [Actinoplanes sp. NBRC 14428]
MIASWSTAAAACFPGRAAPVTAAQKGSSIEVLGQLRAATSANIHTHSAGVEVLSERAGMEIMQYLTDFGRRSPHPIWWNFEFPNNRGATVRPSKVAFRFDVDFDLDGSDHELVRGLDAVEVEALLSEIASSPPLV